MKNKQDQYGDSFPDDLVLLENNDITIHEASEIEKLNWYCKGNKRGVFVSDKELTKAIGEHDFASLWDIYFNDEGVLKVTDNLKRFNTLDGFYQANYA